MALIFEAIESGSAPDFRKSVLVFLFSKTDSFPEGGETGLLRGLRGNFVCWQWNLPQYLDFALIKFQWKR